jgi:hypothetical protein
MTRRIATALFAVLVLTCLRGQLHAWIGPLDIVVPSLPSPTDVLKVIDNLSKQDSNTTVEVKFGSTVSQGKLEGGPRTCLSCAPSQSAGFSLADRLAPQSRGLLQHQRVQRPLRVA